MCALHYFQITAFVIELKHYLQHAKLLRKNKTDARKSVVGVVLNIQAVNFFPKPPQIPVWKLFHWANICGGNKNLENFSWIHRKLQLTDYIPPVRRWEVDISVSAKPAVSAFTALQYNSAGAAVF